MNSIFAAFLGPMELVLVFAVIFLFFGAKRLPGLAKGLGTSIKEFKRASRDDEPAAEKKAALVDKN